MNSNVKGNIAEQAIVLAATKLGVPVLRPVGEHGRVDLGLEIAGQLYRVQCKWGRLSPAKEMILVSTSGSWLSPNGYVRTTYTTEEVDLFAVYCGDLDRCFLLPASLVAGKHEIRLRLTAPRNGQQACITLADDFDFVGAIAQLGERCHGMAEVAGSSPASSTSGRGPIEIGSNPFRDRLGYWLERAERGEEILVTFRGRPRIRLLPVSPKLPLKPVAAA